MGKLTDILKVVSLVVPAINAVERLFRKPSGSLPAENNQARQDAAVQFVGDVAPLVQSLVPAAVIDVPKVQNALRKAIDAVVELHNAIREAVDGVTVGSGT